ncbi:ATPase family AAA domain-containing protein 5b [Thalassophryne amazonica]|uniref:ATPase family AAA domain-containing protein 5b n=1 Tax=Thalassophryne amazonica TaxID=390379 RepID=UPI0014714149|nr:ATPase family AAA domain-containing protein 5b [Thalassophryne amazonica]
MTDKPLQEKKTRCSTDNIKIAPIFVRRRQQSDAEQNSAVSLEEVRESNPAFLPAENMFCPVSVQTSLLHEKRKRGNNRADIASKRLRCSLAAEGSPSTGQCSLPARDNQKPIAPRISRLSRTRRLKQQSGSNALQSNCEPNSKQTNQTKSDIQSLTSPCSLQRDFSFEDVLWTDKYSPQRSSEVIGNSASVTRLRCWLKKWKQRVDCEERRRIDDRKREENGNDSWDCGDFQGEAGSGDEEPLYNAMLIVGPLGVGKTASVYACAQELGFKVFEVNCSSQRSGRNVLSSLKEATQSHLVDTSDKDSLKPAYFINYNIDSCLSISDISHGKIMAPKKICSSRKRPAQKVVLCNRKGKSDAATRTLTNFFKIKSKADHLHFNGMTPLEDVDKKKPCSRSPACERAAAQSKKTTCLILFEEVDVIFNDDVGFLAAVKTLMTTTKRPVVLTTNDPAFRWRFNCSLETIIFKTPSAESVCSYLQLVCLTESAQVELHEVIRLFRLFGGDIRRCLLQLQFWVPHREDPLNKVPRAHNKNITKVEDCLVAPSCTATMLGLHNMTQNHLLNLLMTPSWTEEDMNNLLKPLSESWRRGVPLLYSNLELLLPTGAAPSSLDATHSGLQDEPVRCGVQQQLPKNIRSKAYGSVRKTSKLSRRRGSSSSPTYTSIDSNGKAAEGNVATRWMCALSDFFDLMSYVDVLTLPAEMPMSGLSNSDRFLWTGVEIKDGFMDEMTEEERSCSLHRWEMQAAVEGLGCRRCCWQVSAAWTEVQKCRCEGVDDEWNRLVKKLTIPGSASRERLNFTARPPCPPHVCQKRFDLSKSVVGCQAFSLLGNKKAVAVDYMPLLRFICHSHRPQQQRREPIRCRNYINRMHLGLSKSTFQLLTGDFSEDYLEDNT